MQPEKLVDVHNNHLADPQYYHTCDLDEMDRDHCKYEFKTIVKNNQEEFENELNSLDIESADIIHISTLFGDQGIIWTCIVKHIQEHCSCSRACNLCGEIVYDNQEDMRRIEKARSIDRDTDILSLAKECVNELEAEGFFIDSKTNITEVKEIKEKYAILMMKEGASNSKVAGLLRVSVNTIPAWRMKVNKG